MFSDTHFHFNILEENSRVDVLEKMADNDCYFGLDIGTHSDDLHSRIALFDEVVATCDVSKISKIKKFFNFSCGIWPDVNAIKNRYNEIEILENELISANFPDGTHHANVIAIGECGLDHHWNPSGVDNRCEESFTDEIFLGEKELFIMQLELAKKYNLPVIVHSREAFSDTVDCIKSANYNNGIIHCYSYGLEEARIFLDLDYYIAFGGGVTYTKKSKLEQMHELLKFIPQDRILLETDAPYLAPVPFRGQKNTPCLVEHVYDFISSVRNLSKEELSDIVDSNIKKLFFAE